MIKAVIFDMDGLLIDSEPLWAKAYKAAFKPLGVTVTDEDMREIRGRRMTESIAHLYRKYHWQGPSRRAMEPALREDMLRMIKRQGRLLPGVHHTFEICQHAGLPMAIASSSHPDIINAVVDGLGIRDFFAHIYSGESIPFGKPHPAAFIKTAKLLGVKPEDCLVFEDAPSGVLAAKAAKMTCIAVPDPAIKDHRFIQTADVVLNSLEEFDEALLSKF